MCKEHRALIELCDLVKSCKQQKMEQEDIAKEIVKRYGYDLKHLTYDEYIAWLRSDRKFARIYFEVVARESYNEAISTGGIDLFEKDLYKVD